MRCPGIAKCADISAEVVTALTQQYAAKEVDTMERLKLAAINDQLQCVDSDPTASRSTP